MPSILVVDDDSEFRSLVAATLEDEYEIVEAGRASAALQLTETRAFDLLIIDGLLPDLQGADLISKLRKAEVRTPIIYASAFWGRDGKLFRRLTGEFGVARVLTKPLPPEELLTHVRGVLQGARTTKPPTAASRLDAVRELFKAKLSTRLRDLTDATLEAEKARDRASISHAHQLAHSLHGTAGSLGFEQVGRQAAVLEQALHRMLENPEARSDESGWAVVKAELSALRVPGPSSAPVGGQEDAAPPVRWSARILVVDDDPVFCRYLTEVGRSGLTEVITASSGSGAVDAVASGKPFDGIVIDVSLPGENAFEIAVALRSLPVASDVPLAFVSADPDLKNRIDAVHSGATVFLTKPISEPQFLALVEQLSILRRVHRPSVLVIDDDPEFVELLCATLEEEGINAHVAKDPFEVLPQLEKLEPDLLLLDALMPAASGYDICRIVRAVPRWRDLPVLFLSAQTTAEARIACYRAGGDDYIQKPFLREELVARVRQRTDRSRMMRDLGSRDYLTGLYNRRGFLEIAGQRLAQANRTKHPLAVALLDFDSFKKVNDTYGHLAGDRVLAGFGRLLLSRFRNEDVRGRWGGEELVLAFPESTALRTKELLEIVAEDFRRMKFLADDGRTFSMTFSGGVSSFPSDGTTISELIRRADRLLYEAKARGRDRIQC